MALLRDASTVIGGVGLLLSSSEALLVRNPDPFYADYFLPAAGAFDGPALNIELDPCGVPDVEGWAPMCLSSDAWSIYSRDDLRFVRNNARSGPSNWGAIFPARTDRATLFCRPPAGTDGVVSNPLVYPIDLVLMMYFLAMRQGVVMHSAGIMLGATAIVCPARSGSGKSTLSRQFMAAGMGSILSDDRTILREIGGGLRAYGTPWLGDAGVGSNQSAPLGALLFLRHAGRESLTALSPREAMERMLPAVSIPWYDREVMDGGMAFVERLACGCPAFEFGFTPTPQAAEFLMRELG